MNPVDSILPHFRNMQGYVPGVQRNHADTIKLNSNENPFAVAPAVQTALRQALADDPLQKYPDPSSLKLRVSIANQYQVNPEQVLIGNGSDEILSILFRAMLAPGDRLIVPDPTYSLYPVLTDILDARIKKIPVRDDWHIDFKALLAAAISSERRVPLMVFAHPNAPTGLAEKKTDLINFISNSPCPILVDEAYADFGPFSMAEYVGSSELPGLMVCGTFSKSYSLAGLRVGWLIAPEAVIIELDKIRDSYNVNRLTQVAALAALGDRSTFDSRIELICSTRERIRIELNQLGFDCLESHTNFIFATPPAPYNNAQGAQAYFEFLETRHILIRYFSAPRLSSYIRISIGTDLQMDAVLAATREWLQA